MTIKDTAGECFHRLVKKVKISGKFPDVRFVKAFGKNKVPKPLTGYLAACQIDSGKWEENFFFDSKKGTSIGKFTMKSSLLLMGEKHCEAADIQNLAERLVGTFMRYDSEGYITSCEITEVYFNKDLDTLCQKLTFTMELFVNRSEEIQDGSG